MTDQELKEKIAGLVYDAIARHGGDWLTVSDQYADKIHAVYKEETRRTVNEAKEREWGLWLGALQEAGLNIGHPAYIREGLEEWAKETGFVKLAEDQQLPSSGEVVLLDPIPFETGFHLGQQVMLEAGWRKVILEVK